MSTKRIAMHRPGRRRRVIALMLGVMICQYAVADFQPLFPPASVTGTQTPRGQIIVGVRSHSRPFSYRTGARHDEEMFPDFGGYMIEICRRVLSEMTNGNGPFRDFVVVTRNVNAENRFSMLESGAVDMLCGPDSITPNRLSHYNVSHPVFLSGLTWVTVKINMLPQHNYCQPVLGMLARTTAETVGLQTLADKNELFRFDQALEQYLVMVGKGGTSSRRSSMLSDMDAFTGKHFGKPRLRNNSDKTWVEPVDSSSIITTECPQGFESGPVVLFSSHDDGLEALCRGDIFYYLGDRDILKSRLAGMPDCEFDLKPNTMTKEAYGVFFRRTRMDLESNRRRIRPFPNSALQAEFNNVLLRLMQESANILDYEFKREFAPSAPTSDLQMFFDSFKYASHHIREE